MDLADSISCMNIDQEPTNIKNFAAVINGKHTQFIICAFTNSFTYIITQYGKLGNLYSIQSEQVENGICSNETVFNVRPLLGGDNLDTEVGVRFIYEKLKLGKPGLFSLTLKDYSPNTLRNIVDAIENYKGN